jgi:hypothetical protein
MERKRIFYADMDADPSDMNSLQDYTQRSLDNIVADGITAEARYAAFGSVKSGPTTIRTAPGQLYSGGKVYVRESEYTKDFVSTLPVAGKKIAAIVVWGSEEETGIAAREFLINEETLESEPKTVAMERVRIASINVTTGTEAPDPTPPLVNAGLTVIAYVLLSPTGIETVTMNPDAALPQLGKVDGRLGEVETWKNRVDPQISTIKTDLAKLANQASGNASNGMVLRMAADVARLKERAGLPDNRIDYGADHFLTTDETDVDNPELLAMTEEGIRFAAEAEHLGQLQVFDSYDPRHKIVGGLMLPAYDRVMRMEVGPRTAELSIAQYQYQTHDLVQLMRSRSRVRYGTPYTVCTNSEWWQSGQYDPIAGIFTRNGETFKVAWDAGAGWGWNGADGGHWPMRVQQYWEDTVEEPYWDRVTVDHKVQGAQISQTFLNAQDGWLDAIGLTFTRLAAEGAVHIAIVNCVSGEPDPKQVIAFVTIERDKLKLNDETMIAIPPTYLQAGKRYGIMVTTNADHYVAITDGGNFAQGTLFISTDGAYHQGDLSRDICFSLYFAQFQQARVVIDMAPLELSGGISAIDILAECIEPASTELLYEIQVNSVWHPLRAVQQSALIGLPPLLKLRMVFVGTSDMMPAVHLSGSQVKLFRPRTTFKHISTPRTLPAPAKNIQLQTRLEYFDAAYHGSAARLLAGADYTTAAIPVSVSDVEVPEEDAVERTYLFQLPEAVEDYKIEISGTTTTALKVFHVAERIDIALS